MPFKNEAAFIYETLQSILNQSYSKFDLICIDDHSSDNSPAIVEKIAAKDKRIKLLTKL